MNGGGNAWSSASAWELKENFETVYAVALVERLVAEVPVATWNYRSEDPSVRHLGPVAQDFYAAFGLGDDEGYISTIDADGVALAAIQGLYQLVQEKDQRLDEQEAQITTQQTQIADQRRPQPGRRLLGWRGADPSEIRGVPPACVAGPAVEAGTAQPHPMTQCTGAGDAASDLRTILEQGGPECVSCPRGTSVL